MSLERAEYGVAGCYTLSSTNDTDSQFSRSGHACNCIGCCRKCGRCRTAPWHAATCDAVTELRRKERVLVSDAMMRLRSDRADLDTVRHG